MMPGSSRIRHRAWRAVAGLLLAASVASPARPDEAARWFFTLEHGVWSKTPSAGVAYHPQIDLEESVRGGALVRAPKP